MEGKKIKIGLFDSGIGGFSILREIMGQAPGPEYYYFADREYAPYGNLSDKDIVQRSRLIVQYLKDSHCDLVLFACNTATNMSIELLRGEFDLPLIGVEPYINIVNQVADVGQKWGVLLTHASFRSEKFNTLKSMKDPNGQVQVFTSSNLASLVEEFWHGGDQDDWLPRVHQELEELRESQVTHLILGCTHYPLIQEVIENYLSIKTICPAAQVASHALSRLGIEISRGQDLPAFFYSEALGGEWKKLAGKNLWPKIKLE